MLDAGAIVFLTLAAVAIAACMYRPRSLFGGWAVLADFFATEQSPRTYRHGSRRLYFTPIWTGWALPPLIRVSGEYAKFDVDIGKEGIWLRYRGPKPFKCAEHMLIPWKKVVNAKRTGDFVSLELDTEPHMWVQLPADLAAEALEMMK